MTEKIVWRWFVTAAVLVVCTLLAVYVWPTRFRDEQTHVSGVPGILRTDRFSGEARLYLAYPYAPKNTDGSVTLGRQK